MMVGLADSRSLLVEKSIATLSNLVFANMSKSSAPPTSSAWESWEIRGTLEGYCTYHGLKEFLIHNTDVLLNGKYKKKN